MGRAKAMCGELATARAPAPGPRSPSAPGPRRLCLGTDSKAGRGVGALYGGDGGAPGVPRLWAVGWGSCGQAH